MDVDHITQHKQVATCYQIYLFHDRHEPLEVAVDISPSQGVIFGNGVFIDIYTSIYVMIPYLTGLCYTTSQLKERLLTKAVVLIYLQQNGWKIPYLFSYSW